MSLKPLASQRSFYHTDYLCGDLFSAANRYRLFRENIWPKLLELEPKLHALYCEENGRPAVDPVLLCGVTLLQFMGKFKGTGYFSEEAKLGSATILRLRGFGEISVEES